MATAQSSTGTSSQKRQSAASQDAIALLKQDHRTVEDLFDEFEKARKEERKQALVSQICQELTIHAELEEKAFYPQVQEALGEDRDLVAEARVEHASLKWLIAQIEKESGDKEMWEARVTVLKEYVEHHVKEEEKQMFPKVRKTELDLQAMGEVLVETKEKLTARIQKPAAH